MLLNSKKLNCSCYSWDNTSVFAIFRTIINLFYFQISGYGYFEIVKLLIENGADIDLCTKTKSTPLRAACYLGRADIVEYLIEHGSNVNLTNIFNSTCIMIASYKGTQMLSIMIVHIDIRIYRC